MGDDKRYLKPSSNPFERYWDRLGANRRKDRPWWATLVTDMLKRVDGLACVSHLSEPRRWSVYSVTSEEPNAPHSVDSDDILAYVDREFPLPAPPPMVGQVWVSGAWETSVSAVLYGFQNNRVQVHWSQGISEPTPEPETFLLAEGAPGRSTPMWPPKKALLVWGPGAPWAPPGWLGGSDV